MRQTISGGALPAEEVRNSMDQIVRREPQHSPDHPEGRILRCAFTGYRPQKMPFGFDEEDLRCIDFKQRLGCTIDALIWSGYCHFMTGGALGFDTFAAEAVMSKRRKYPWVTLEVAVPFDKQPDRWEAFSQDRYHWILEQADIVTWISHEYTKGCLFKRNCYLVDNSDLLIAAYDGQPGGTAQAVAYARSRRREIRFIPPVVQGMRKGAWYYEEYSRTGNADARGVPASASCG